MISLSTERYIFAQKLYKFLLLRLFNRRRPAADLQFQVDIMQMGLHGACGNTKFFGNLIPLEAFRGQGEDLKLMA